ncbi:hypothetical protein C8F04DRAFT_504836 [Mycena alexandri]|uniref:Uncharacterized protein n=1 Tax=Mycena alexandri TaxID=1745969 RepID=A0AAD6X5M3_9AGAR|nr:hypothetical protein C8F04DRAFT_504836 [Mycena alexandri]
MAPKTYLLCVPTGQCLCTVGGLLPVVLETVRALCGHYYRPDFAPHFSSRLGLQLVSWNCLYVTERNTRQLRSTILIPRYSRVNLLKTRTDCEMVRSCTTFIHGIEIRSLPVQLGLGLLCFGAADCSRQQVLLTVALNGTRKCHHPRSLQNKFNNVYRTIEGETVRSCTICVVWSLNQRSHGVYSGIAEDPRKRSRGSIQELK